MPHVIMNYATYCSVEQQCLLWSTILFLCLSPNCNKNDLFQHMPASSYPRRLRCMLQWPVLAHDMHTACWLAIPTVTCQPAVWVSGTLKWSCIGKTLLAHQAAQALVTVLVFSSLRYHIVFIYGSNHTTESKMFNGRSTAHNWFAKQNPLALMLTVQVTQVSQCVLFKYCRQLGVVVHEKSNWWAVNPQTLNESCTALHGWTIKTWHPAGKNTL